MWDPTPVGALSYGSGLDGNDPLPRHISRVYYFVGTSCGRWCSRDDYSHMGGSSDAKPWTLGGECLWDFERAYIYVSVYINAPGRGQYYCVLHLFTLSRVSVYP